MITQARKYIWVKQEFMHILLLSSLMSLFFSVLEYMEGGEIVWRTPDDEPVLSVSQARQIFRDLVSGLDYSKCYNHGMLSNVKSIF